MRTVKEVAKEWHKSKSFREAYDALEDEYARASAEIEARMLKEAIASVHEVRHKGTARGSPLPS